MPELVDVHVAVEQAGQQRHAGDVDPLVTVQAEADLTDPPVLDQQVTVGHRAAGAVEDSPAVQDRPAHVLFLPGFQASDSSRLQVGLGTAAAALGDLPA